MQCYGTLALCLDINDIAVLQAVFFSGFQIQMHVTCCNDNTFLQLQFALRTDELSACAACDVAAVADRSIKANLACVSQRKLNLSFRTQRTDDTQLHGILGSYHGNLFFGSKLTGLANRLFNMQLAAFTK